MTNAEKLKSPLLSHGGIEGVRVAVMQRVEEEAIVDDNRNRTNCEHDWSTYKRQRNRVTGLIKRCKSKYHQDILRDSADSPDKFWSAIKKLFPTKLTSEQGSAFQINGTKTTDKKSIAEYSDPSNLDPFSGENHET